MSACRDRMCEPHLDAEGCMAHDANLNAHDGLDGAWTPLWDDCPVMAAETARSEAEEHEERQWLAWVERIGDEREASCG